MSRQERRAETWQNTIVSFEAPHSLRAMTVEPPERRTVRELPNERQQLKIRLASNQDRRQSADLLIKKMYSWRGYNAGQTLDPDAPDQVTLMAFADEVTIGTITVGFDSPNGLMADEIYSAELNQLRTDKRLICEMTKLAVDQQKGSKHILASLFHIAYIYARHVRKCTDAIIEVNPRHVRFYEKTLGFRQWGPEKICPRASAPAVLLRLEFDYTDIQIQKFGGHADKASSEKSIYPYFFSKTEELGITGKLLNKTS